jgi:Domain of unknown function (DUF4372)
MYKGQTVFLQLTDHLPRHTFRRLVKRYNANHQVRTFTCWEQFLATAFGQLTYRESSRLSKADYLGGRFLAAFVLKAG